MEFIIGALFSILAGYSVMKKSRAIDPSRRFMKVGVIVLSIILTLYGVGLLYFYLTGKIA